MGVTMAEQQSAAARSSDAAMALAAAATVTHALAEIRAAEDTLAEALAALDRSHAANEQRALEAYRYSVREALRRADSTMSMIRGGEDSEDDDQDDD